MSRISRIPHPEGSRFVAIFEWVVRLFGMPAAAVLGVVDFHDRREEHPGQPVVSRMRILADLEGIVSRNKVDESLKLLTEEVGWLIRYDQTVKGERNFQTSSSYALCAPAIADFLKRKSSYSQTGNPGIPEQGTQESLSGDQSRSPNRESSIRGLEVEEPPPTSPQETASKVMGKGGEIDEIVEALAWESVQGGIRIVSRAAYEAKLRSRLAKEVTSADLAALEAYRQYRAACSAADKRIELQKVSPGKSPQSNPQVALKFKLRHGPFAGSA